MLLFIDSAVLARHCGGAADSDGGELRGGGPISSIMREAPQLAVRRRRSAVAAALLRRRGAAPPHSVGRRLAVCHPPAPGATSSPRGRRACRTRSSACAAASGGFGAAPSSEPAPLHTRCAFQSPSLPAAATAARRRRSGLFLAVAAGNSAHGAERTQPRRFLCVCAAPPARCDRQCGYVLSGSEQWSERARGAPKEPTPATPRFQGVPHRLGAAFRA